MSLFQSFFIDAIENNQCEELNNFIKTHAVVRTIENLISTPTKTGIQILVEYRETQTNLNSEKSKKIDYRSQLSSDEKKLIFDKLKEFRATFAKEKKLVGYVRYMDDMIIFSKDKEELKMLLCKSSLYLQQKLFLELKIYNIGYCENGVPFLGRLIKPDSVDFLRKKKKRKYNKIKEINRLYEEESLLQEKACERMFCVMNERLW